MSEIKSTANLSKDDIIQRVKDRLQRNRSVNETKPRPTRSSWEPLQQNAESNPAAERRRRIPRDWYMSVQRSTSLNDTTSRPPFENYHIKTDDNLDAKPENNHKQNKHSQTNYISYDTFTKTRDAVNENDDKSDDYNDANQKQTQTCYVSVEKSNRVGDMLKDMRTRRVLSERAPPLPTSEPPNDVVRNTRDGATSISADKLDGILRKEQTRGYTSVYGDRSGLTKSYPKGKIEPESPPLSNKDDRTNGATSNVFADKLDGILRKEQTGGYASVYGNRGGLTKSYDKGKIEPEHDDYFRKKYEEIDKIEATWSGKSDEFARVNNHIKKLQEVFEDLSTYNNNLAGHLNRMVGVTNEHTEQISNLEVALQRSTAELNHWKGAYETMASKTKKLESEIDKIYAILNKMA